jgi:formate-dependent phosphoribosylglycinamide formyltransferase (GAR transformylase)
MLPQGANVNTRRRLTVALSDGSKIAQPEKRVDKAASTCAVVAFRLVLCLIVFSSLW